jgi:hypothetical protein
MQDLSNEADFMNHLGAIRIPTSRAFFGTFTSTTKPLSKLI